jgi:hypothetical protein
MATYNDGSIPYGVGTVTDIDTSLVYVVEDFAPDLASTVIERRDGVGVMTGRVVIDDQAATNRGWTATLTLQRATVTTPIPAVGAQLDLQSLTGFLDLNLATDGGAAVRVIGSSGAQSQTAAHTFSLRIAGEINF